MIKQSCGCSGGGGGGGGGVLPVRRISFAAGSKILTPADGIVICDCTGGAFTITMAPADFQAGWRSIIVVKDPDDVSANQLAISDGVAEINRLINPNDSCELTALGASILVS